MTNLLFLGNLGMGELLIIALIVLLLFGATKIPELMKGLGKGVKSFKDGMNGIEEELKSIDAPKKADADASSRKEADANSSSRKEADANA